MKIRADEHVSPKIVRAVQSLILSAGWELTHVREFNFARTPYETWIPRFVLEGGNAILSADRKMLARPHQLAAIRAGNLIGVFLPEKWALSRRHYQAAHILWWWPKIEQIISEANPGDCWKVPWEFGNGRLEPIPVNYAKAAAALKSQRTAE